MSRLRWIEAWAQAFRYAIRMLRKNPGFSAIAVLSVALGVGVNTTMFSVINAVLLRSVPFPDPDRLVRLVQQHSGGQATIPEYQFVKEHARVFSSVAAYRAGGERRLEARGVQTWVTALTVTDDFLRTLGMLPLVGRELSAAETRAGGAASILISDGVWRSSFGADPAVLGQPITLNGAVFTIVGVLPPHFWFPQPVDVLVPLRPTGGLGDLGANNEIVARLREDVELTRAQAHVADMAGSLRQALGGVAVRNYRGLSVLSYHDWLVGDVRANLLLLFGATGLLLLISCANVAMLLLTRGAARAKEIGVRLALGGERHLLRQFLTENLVIVALGALIGVGAAYQLVRGFTAWVPFTLPVSTAIHVDAAVLAFTVAVSLGTAVVFTLVPLASARRLKVEACLRSEGRNVGSGVVRARTRNLLVVSEVALSTMLLIASGLLIQSLLRLQHERLGFSTDGVMTFETPLAPERANDAADRLRFTRALLERLEQLPGVDSAAATTVLPLAGQSNVPAEHEGHPEHSIGGMEVRPVTPAYFEILGIPLRGGRWFLDADASPSALAVVLVNETVARAWWPETSPIGDRLTIGRFQGREFFKDGPRQVVGIVGDTKSATLRSPPRPTVYVPMGAAFGGSSLAWAVKTDATSNLGAQIRSALTAIDPGQRVRRVRWMTEIVAATSATSRFNATLFGVFAGMALLLAALGLYGVLSFLVTQRRQEIGTRIALGASRRQVLGLFLRQGVMLTGSGLGVGIAGALVVSRWLATLLFGVTSTDPLSFVVVSVVLLGIGTAASYLPARRAASIDPMAAIRSE